MRHTQFDYRESQSAGPADMAEWWDEHWSDRRGLKADLTDEPVWSVVHDIVTQPGNLLEAGCGTGQWVRFLGQRGHKCIGIDFAPSGLRIGKTFDPSLHLLQGDLRDMPFAAQSFDYVLCLGAVEHDINGPERALREFHRVLRPGGRLMCSVPCLNIERHILLPWLELIKWLKRRELLRRLFNKQAPFEFYQYVFSIAEYWAILRKSGFEVLTMRPYGGKPAGALTRLVGRVDPRLKLWLRAHMMMAICRPAGPASVPAADRRESLALTEEHETRVGHCVPS